jgi:hypothetical protein
MGTNAANDIFRFFDIFVKRTLSPFRRFILRERIRSIVCFSFILLYSLLLCFIMFAYLLVIVFFCLFAVSTHSIKGTEMNYFAAASKTSVSVSTEATLPC